MKIKILLSILIVFCLVFSGIAYAVPANPKVVELEQPDGSTIKARLMGDERGSWYETQNGEILEKTSEGFYEEASNVPGKSPSRASAKTTKEMPAVKSNAPVTGDLEVVVLLINFTNVTQDIAHTQAYYQDLLFNESNPDSMWSYFDETSYGQLNVTGGVYGWFPSAQTMEYYGAHGTACAADPSGDDEANVCIYELAREAVQLADSSLDFSDYDSDSDDYVDYVIVVHAGGAEENGDGADTIWSHKWSISGGEDVDSVTVSSYTMLSEDSPVGTFAHEFAHDLGLPDLYDADGTSSGGESDGAGTWDIMGHGSWNGVPAGSSPAHLSAWSKYFLGWINVTQITSTQTIDIENVESNGSAVFMILNSTVTSGNIPNSGGNQYFLIENRQQLGFDSALSGAGLLIWHIDDSVGTISGNSVNVNPDHLRVKLEEADDNDELKTYGGSQGEPGDTWKSSTYGFNSTSSPNSSYYNNTITYVAVSNINASGDVMQADLGFENQEPVINITAPNSTSIWNSSHNITWTATDSDNDTLTYKLEYNNGTDWISINDSFTSTGKYYTWNVTDIDAGNNYTVRLTANDSIVEVNDTSETFGIGHSPAVAVLYPNGGERVNGTITINATVTDSDGQDDIEIVYFYYSINGSSWTLIGNDTNNSDSTYSVSWNTSAANESLYAKVNATAVDPLFNVSDVSNSNFTIDNVNVAPVVTITEPDEDDTWAGTKAITWTATDADNDTLDIKLEYYDSSWHTIVSDTDNDGTYSWDTTDVDDGDYSIRITAEDPHTATDSETVDFEISNDDESGGGGGGFNDGTTTTVSGDYSHEFLITAAGVPAIWTVPSSSEITEISIKTNIAVDATLGLTVLNSKPSSISITPSNVYKYFEITEDNLASTDLTEAVIKFKIPISWFGNSYSANSVKLERWNSGRWNQLTTTKLNSDATYNYYSAITPGFSYFAITAGVSQTSAETDLTQTNDVKMMTSDEARGISSLTNLSNSISEGFSTISLSTRGKEMIFAIFAGLALVLSIIYVRYKLHPYHPLAQMLKRHKLR